MTDNIVLDVEQIKKLLPHRPPMLLVEKLADIVPGQSATGYKAVSINEPFFMGHFPERAVMPGVLIIEAMAQAAAILSFVTMGAKGDDQSIYYFVGIDNARFKRPVTPGDALRLEVTLTRHVRGIWKFSAIARVDAVVAAEAELMCTVRDLPGDAA